MTLEEVLADVRGEAAVLRANGHKAQADSMEAVCDRVRDCMSPYLDWLTESEAELASGRSGTWLKSRFAEWMDLGMARLVPQHRRRAERQYRRCIIPRRANRLAAYEAGRKAAAA